MNQTIFLALFGLLYSTVIVHVYHIYYDNKGELLIHIMRANSACGFPKV